MSTVEQDEKGYRIVKTERAVFEALPHATHFRYPIVYGPYQALLRGGVLLNVLLIRDRTFFT